MQLTAERGRGTGGHRRLAGPPQLHTCRTLRQQRLDEGHHLQHTLVLQHTAGFSVYLSLQSHNNTLVHTPNRIVAEDVEHPVTCHHKKGILAHTYPSCLKRVTDLWLQAQREVLGLGGNQVDVIVEVVIT